MFHPIYKLGMPYKLTSLFCVVSGIAGDKIIGIGVLHKSCLQPIFNKEAAEDIAKMRR